MHTLHHLFTAISHGAVIRIALQQFHFSNSNVLPISRSFISYPKSTLWQYLDEFAFYHERKTNEHWTQLVTGWPDRHISRNNITVCNLPQVRAVVSISVFFFPKLNVFFWILWSYKYTLFDSQNKYFRGDLSDISSVTATPVSMCWSSHSEYESFVIARHKVAVGIEP